MSVSLPSPTPRSPLRDQEPDHTRPQRVPRTSRCGHLSYASLLQRVTRKLKMLASARIISSREQTVRSILRCFTFSLFIQCAACLEAIHTPAFCSRHLVLVAALVSQPTSIQLVQTKSSDRQYFTAGSSSYASAVSSPQAWGASTAMSMGSAMSRVDFVRSTILVSAIFARSFRRTPTVVRSSTLAARVALTLGG